MEGFGRPPRTSAPADARPKASIDVTGLFTALTERADRQLALEQRRRLELGRGFSDPDDIPGDDDIYGDDPDLYPESAFDEFGRIRFIETAPPPEKVVYDSKEHNPGCGYPSCSRALVRTIKAYRDPNNYYAYIGVMPDASFGQIKKAVRKLYQKYHPDGWMPDVAEFDYIREIAHVLTDPKRRLRYDNLDNGEKWLDSRVREELGIVDDDSAIDLGDFIKGAEESAWSTMKRTGGGDPESFRPGEQPRKGITSASTETTGRADAMRQVDEDNGYDFFAEPLCPGDFARAQLWYHYLVRMAPLGHFTRPIRVWLNNEQAPYWSDIGGIIKIPRHWWPCDANAFALMMVVIHDTSPQSGADVRVVR